MSFKYLQLAAALQAEIVQGAFPDKLPTEKELTERYQVSRQTVRQALERLVELGLIEKRQGSGSRVLPQTLVRGSGRIAIMTSYIDDYIFPTVLQDMQKLLTQRNYSTMLFATRNSADQEREILQRLSGTLTIIRDVTGVQTCALPIWTVFRRCGRSAPWRTGPISP